jgi:hypothetical protein
MSLLSKSEIQYLQGQKQVSRSYEYKLRSMINKKVANLLDKEIPLLSKLFPDVGLTDFGKEKSPLKATIPGSNPGRSIPISRHLQKDSKIVNGLSKRGQILKIIIRVNDLHEHNIEKIGVNNQSLNQI